LLLFSSCKNVSNDVMYHGVGLYQDLVIPVTNFHNEDKGLMVLAGDVFDVPIRKDIIHRVVRWQLAKRQQVVMIIIFDFWCLKHVVVMTVVILI
jgi:hypothetical protein